MTNIIVNLSPEFLILQKEKHHIHRHIKELKNEIRILEISLKQEKEKEKNINKKIFKICKHKWRRDWSTVDDDICKHFCGICGLSHIDGT